MPSKERSLVVTLSISAVFSALVAISTSIFQIPIPATGGYINVGDAMIFTTALLFGPLIGGAAGGIGSAIGDLILGYASFAPYTFVVKGLEGLIAGYVSDGETLTRDILAWVVSSSVMVSGYFLMEAYVMGIGPVSAFVEVPGNIFQVVFGGVIGLPLSRFLRKNLPSSLT